MFNTQVLRPTVMSRPSLRYLYRSLQTTTDNVMNPA